MRNYKIDILRGISILLVLLHHFNIPYKLHDTLLGFDILGQSFSTLLARNGNYGVTMFFVISGFLITQHSLKRSSSLSSLNIKAFYIRRIARIIPSLLLLVLVVSLLGLAGLTPFLNQAPNGITVSYTLTLVAALSFWMNLLIIEYGWVNYALGVLWSLAVEEVFYLAFPFLCLLSQRRYLFTAILLGIILYAPYFRSLHFGEDSGAYLYHYFASFDGIAMGCLAALFWHVRPQRWPYPRILSLILSMAMVGLYVYAPIKAVSSWGISLFALLTALLILNVQHPSTKAAPSNALSGHMVWLGQRSYEIYLFHLVILGLVKVYFVPAETMAAAKLPLLLVYLVLALLLGAVIERYYSSPLNQLIRNKLI